MSNWKEPWSGAGQVLAGLLLLGCTGEVRSPSEGTPAMPFLPGAPAPEQPTALPGGQPSATTSCGSTDPGFVGARRLTRVEIDNSLRDLLGEAGRPALALPSEDSLLAEQATLSPLTFEKLDAITDRAIDESWTRELAGSQPAGVKLQVCPLKPGDAGCARMIISAFARKALRRPLAVADLEPLHAFVALATSKGDDVAVGVKLAMKAVLLSPEFLYRIETDSPAPRPLTAHELASRLSFWLWSSIPDAPLSALADSGALLNPATLQAEVMRMLKDPRARAFADGFGEQWLGLYALEAAHPDPTVFKSFDEPLRAAMLAETRSFARAFVDENRPIPDLLDADFTFVNDRLSRHYGLPAVAGADLRRVTVPAGPRRGVLGQGSILTMTSAATRTSPVKRGKWIFSKLLCGEMPPPPPNAEALSAEAKAAKTERERLRIHRANPACAGCHNILDPLGLGMESFDGIGQHRSSYLDGSPIDAAGELLGSGRFTTFEELRAMIKIDPRVPACVTQKMLTYAIGRELTSTGDGCLKDGLAQTLARSQGGLRDLVLAVVNSPLFRMRRGELAGGAP